MVVIVGVVVVIDGPINLPDRFDDDPRGPLLDCNDAETSAPWST